MLDIQTVCTNLRRGGDGIWYSKDSQAISYPAGGNESCFTVEDNSFWFKHRNECIISLVQKYPPRDGGAIFDIGGGNGCVSAALADSGFDVAMVEPGPIGAANARSRGLDTVICATTDTAQFKSRSLAAIGLFDVVEHIEDDLSFLQAMHNLLVAGGQLYVTVPAYALLWSDEDVSAGHFRRYTLAGICAAIERAGFEVEFSSYIFRFLPVPIALLRAIPYRLGLSRPTKNAQGVVRDHAARGGLIARLLNRLLTPEIKRLRSGRSMNFGGSCVIVAKASRGV